MGTKKKRKQAKPRIDCPRGCGAKVHTATEHLTIGEAGERWTCAPDAPERKPLCLREMGCLCAGHARGNPADAPCDTSETEDTSANERVCCTVCGSLNVGYAVWYYPNASHQDFDVFGSWNNGDNSHCPDCDLNGRNPNPPLVCDGTHPSDSADYLKARAKRLGQTIDGKVIPPTHDAEGARIDEHGNPTEDPDAL